MPAIGTRKKGNYVGLFSRKKTASKTGTLENVDIVGESYRQSALKKILQQAGYSIKSLDAGERVRHETTALLVPENDNAVDPDAVRVMINKQHVGYLSEESASEYREVAGDSTAQISVFVYFKQGHSNIAVFAL